MGALGEEIKAVLDKYAELAFNAYNDHGPNPWQTFDGRVVPRWMAINEAVKNKWRAAVSVFISA